jgi:hypothetical protein
MRGTTWKCRHRHPERSKQRRPWGLTRKEPSARPSNAPARRRPSATPARPTASKHRIRAPIAQRGKAKQKRTDLRRIGLGLVVTRAGGIPLVWHAYPREPARRHPVPRPDRPPRPPLRRPARQQHDHIATDQRALFDPYNLQRWAHQQRLRSWERTPTAPPLTCKNNPHDQLIRESPRAGPRPDQVGVPAVTTHRRAPHEPRVVCCSGSLSGRASARS